METVYYYDIAFCGRYRLENIEGKYRHGIGHLKLDSMFDAIYNHCQTLKTNYKTNPNPKIVVQKYQIVYDIAYITDVYVSRLTRQSRMLEQNKYDIPQGINPENLLKKIVPKHLNIDLLLEVEPRLRDLMPLYTSILCGPDIASIVYN